MTTVIRNERPLASVAPLTYATGPPRRLDLHAVSLSAIHGHILILHCSIRESIHNLLREPKGRDQIHASALTNKEKQIGKSKTTIKKKWVRVQPQRKTM